MRAPHLRTKRISSRVAPASSAARMWCRVPSGIEVRAGGVQTHTDQFDELARQNPSDPGVRGHPQACRSPRRVPGAQLFQGRVLWSGRRRTAVGATSALASVISTSHLVIARARIGGSRPRMGAGPVDADALITARAHSSWFPRRRSGPAAPCSRRSGASCCRPRRSSPCRPFPRPGSRGCSSVGFGGRPRCCSVSSTLLYHTPTFMILRASSAVATLRPNSLQMRTTPSICLTEVARSAIRTPNIVLVADPDMLPEYKGHRGQRD